MNRDIKIDYAKKAKKFLLKNSNTIKENDIDNLIILAIKKLIFKADVNIDLKFLKANFKDFYRIRKGKIRIVFELFENEVLIQSIINDIDFRGNIYKS